MVTTPRTVADLVAAEHAGTLPEPLFFWGHRPPAEGGLGPSCLSQWWPAPFERDDRVLVEASPTDAIWGIGLRAADPDAATPSRWPGENLLGFALMRVRAELTER